VLHAHIFNVDIGVPRVIEKSLQLTRCISYQNGQHDILPLPAMFAWEEITSNSPLVKKVSYCARIDFTLNGCYEVAKTMVKRGENRPKRARIGAQNTEPELAI
jgi:hypothetical protein